MDNVPFHVRQELLYNHILFVTLLMVSFYIHSYFIYPLRNKTYGIYNYIGGLAILLILYIILESYLLPNFPRTPGIALQATPGLKNLRQRRLDFSPAPFMELIPLIFVITVSFCYRLYIDTVSRDKLIKEREYAHIQTELDFLRSQISPHFIFNLMNTLVLMARKKSDLLESSLVSLSQLMRYMLYETDENQLNMATEIEYLKNYINLQLLRFGDDIKVNLHLDGLFEKYTIEPMLIIPFIENAFKHSIGIVDKATIDVSVAIDEKEHILNLSVLNSIAETTEMPAKSSGIGLANVKRRLELLYPGRHLFTINKDNNKFIVNLQINL